MSRKVALFLQESFQLGLLANELDDFPMTIDEQSTRKTAHNSKHDRQLFQSIFSPVSSTTKLTLAFIYPIIEYITISVVSKGKSVLRLVLNKAVSVSGTRNLQKSRH